MRYNNKDDRMRRDLSPSLKLLANIVGFAVFVSVNVAILTHSSGTSTLSAGRRTTPLGTPR